VPPSQASLPPFTAQQGVQFNFGPDLAVAPAQMSQTPKEILPQIHGKSRPDFGPDALFVYLASNPLLVV